jgi:hypothetical protein
VSEPTGSYTVYRYIGDGAYVMGVPARDLFPADLLMLAERSIPESVLIASGLYEPNAIVEIEPFCGAPLADGGRCKETVSEWGQRCPIHEGGTNGNESISPHPDRK